MKSKFTFLRAAARTLAALSLSLTAFNASAADITSSDELGSDVLTEMQTIVDNNSGYVYFFNNTASWDAVYFYSWSGTNNASGEACAQLTTDTSIWYWTYTAENGYGGFLFKDTEGSSSWENQTGDYTPKDGGFYNYVAQGTAGTCAFSLTVSGESADETTEESTNESEETFTTDQLTAIATQLATNPYTIFYDNSANSTTWSDCTFYTWSQTGYSPSSTSSSMTALGSDSDVWYYSESSDLTGLTFLLYNGTWSNTTQTADVTWTNGGYYTYSSNSKSSGTSACEYYFAYDSTTSTLTQYDASGEVETYTIAVSVANTTTAIAAIDADAAQVDNSYYTLQGIRLAERPTTRGLYIHQGKLVMVK